MSFSLEDKRKLLENNPFFSHISSDELDSIVKFSIEDSYNHGKIIFLKGDVTTTLLGVLKGEIEISSSSANGKKIILNTIHSGEIFGEMALIDGMVRSASATAIGNCTLLTINRLDFIPFLERHPKIAIHWLKILCQKLRKAGEKIENVATLPVQARLAKFLLTAAETQAKKIDEGLYLGWRKSQSEIGQEIATTRETVNIQLKQWEKKGIVKLGGQTRSITILDSKALDDIANDLD